MGGLKYDFFITIFFLLIERCFYVCVCLWEDREILYPDDRWRGFESFLCGLHIWYTHSNHASVLVWNTWKTCYTWLPILIILGKDSDVLNDYTFALLLNILKSIQKNINFFKHNCDFEENNYKWINSLNFAFSLLILNCIFFSECMIFRVHILRKLVDENPPFNPPNSSLAYVSSVWQRFSDHHCLLICVFVCLLYYTVLFTFF